MMTPYKDVITSSPDLTTSSRDALGFMNIIACSLRRISFRILKSSWSIPNIGGRVTAINSLNKWHYMACLQSKCWRCTDIPHFHRCRAGSHWFEYISFESRSKWKRKSINKSVSLPWRTNELLTALSTVVLTIKTSASFETCIFEHPFPDNFLLRFCSYFESARNSSFFDLKCIFSQ